MKRTILFLLLAWIAIYAGNHLLFKSVSNKSEVETAVQSRSAPEVREIDSWGPYLPDVRTKDDQTPNVASIKAPPPNQKSDSNLKDDERIAENFANLDPADEQVEHPTVIPPTPGRKPHAVSSVQVDLARDRGPDQRSRAPNIASEQKRKTVAEQKRKVVRAARNTAPRFANMPDEPPWFPSPPPRRWRSGMFMFAPPDF
jgi:hypothetical protein